MDNYIKLNSNITVSGSNGCGKSHFIKYFIMSFNSFDFILIFSNTAGFNNSYDFIKTKYAIFSPVYHDDVIKNFMKIQSDNIKRKIERKVLIVYDDICGSLKDNKFIKTLTTQNRHFFTTIIFCVQYINLAPTYLREVSYYDIIFELKSENSLKACYQNYFIADFDTFGEFKKKIVNLLQKYQFLFADRLTHTKKIMKCPDL